jgi:hypothetical protein
MTRLVHRMANLFQSPKSCKDWTTNDLIAYNITVTAQSPQQFFLQNPEPPLTNTNIVHPSLINDADNNVPDVTFHYLTQLDLASNASHHQKAFIVDFSRETLRILGFAERGLALCTYYTISPDNSAQPDVCLLHRRSRILLILQETSNDSNSNSKKTQPEPHLIAEAIVAYQYNNVIRRSRGLTDRRVPV